MNEIRYYFLSTFFCVVEKWVDFFSILFAAKTFD